MTDASGADAPDPIGELYDRLPTGEWVNLPQFGVRVKAFAPPLTCPHGPHRGPQGPNEDLSQCATCRSPSWSMRPEGETFGTHLPDCSLPPRHESYCKPGGLGHPPAPRIRGYWPITQRTQEEK